MDGIDGIELCKKLRKINPSIYILMISASSDDYTKIKSYEAGCDDFVGKPIKMKLLVNKIKAIQSRLIKSPEIVEHTLNNYSNPASNSIIEINDIRIDLDSYIVHVGDKKCELPKKQFELLVMLAKKPNKVFTREKIYDQIWGDSVVGERTLDVHITRLRNRLGVNFIKSIKGVGYKIIDTNN
jgi:two-component system alkaline phosphatase synthesis response regulator PhoP